MLADALFALKEYWLRFLAFINKAWGTDAVSSGESNLPDGLVRRRAACISQAKDLLASAKRILVGEGLHHIAFHLAVLALEEIGKAELLVVNHHAGLTEQAARKRVEDHERKLFWALWSEMLGKEVITKDQIEYYKGFAKRLHLRRMEGLYVDSDSDETILPRDKIDKEYAQNILQLAEARIELEAGKSFGGWTTEQREDLKWFTEATENPENRRFIFSGESMKQLAALGHPRKWMHWLREEIQNCEAEGSRLLRKEMERKQPSAEEAGQAKWRVRIRLYSNSHSIRQAPLNWWNSASSWIKLKSVDRQRDCLDVEFTLPKNIPYHAVWYVGWGVAKKFIVALNMGSLGFFWWYVPEQISRFYEKIEDIEAEVDFQPERQPILRLDWKQDVLTEQQLVGVARCFGGIPGPDEPQLHEPFGLYCTGLALLSKNDIHLQFELDAFQSFYAALKSGMKRYADWDGKEPIEDAFRRIAHGFKAPEHGFWELAENAERGAIDRNKLTLSEAGAMKLMCDCYFGTKFKGKAEMPSGPPSQNSDLVEPNQDSVKDTP